ncbi:MAG: hypothetical protein H7Y32_00010 [Chloroflexales bacterium]|nr:hypothetical protein [Chloroflexales bacterium]
MKRTLFLIILLAAAVVWNMDLTRRLRAAQMRGDMYHDISARLDRRIAELSAEGER